MSGKGDRDRTTNRISYEESYNRIFRGGKLDSTKVGVTVSPVTESPPSDVGATPTSSNGTVAQQAEHLICNQTVAGSIPVSTSTIDSAPFRAPPIRHGIRKIIE